MIRSVEENRPFVGLPASISWRMLGQPSKGVLSWEGTFKSPQSSILPDGVGDCHFMLLIPLDANEWQPPADASPALPVSSARDVVVLLPATGEETYDTRVVHGLRLVRERGAIVIAITAPFYGARQIRRHTCGGLSWLGQPLGNSPETVEHLLSQSVSIIAEGGEYMLKS